MCDKWNFFSAPVQWTEVLSDLPSPGNHEVLSALSEPSTTLFKFLGRIHGMFNQVLKEQVVLNMHEILYSHTYKKRINYVSPLYNTTKTEEMYRKASSFFCHNPRLQLTQSKRHPFTFLKREYQKSDHISVSSSLFWRSKILMETKAFLNSLIQTFKWIYQFIKLFGFNITCMRFQPKAGIIELDSVQRKGKSAIEKAKTLNGMKEGTIILIL